jgi:PAS domain S-box-containing protein
MSESKQETKHENHYQQVVSLANVAILKFDRNFLLTAFEGNSEKIFGFRKEEVLGRSIYETIVPRYESTGRDLKELFGKLLSDINSYEYNTNENITKKGEKIWMQWHNSAIRDDRNELIEVLSIGVNITERIRTENALKESEERFKTLSDLTFEGILIHKDGIILDCNLSFQRQIGYTREELIGMDFRELIPSAHHKILKKNMEQESAQYEAEAIHKSGTILPVSIESRITKFGNKTFRVAAIRNISEQKKTIRELDTYKNQLEELVKLRTQELKQQSKALKKQNETLQTERNELRTIIDNIPDLIYIKDKEGRFLNANIKQVQHLKMQHLDDIVGKTDFDYYERKYADVYNKDEQEIIKSNKPLINKEELSVNQFNQQIYLSTTKVPLKDKKGKVIGIVGIGKDITEKIIAENQLKTQAENLEKSNILLAERTKKIEILNAELVDFNKKLESANAVLHERKEELETILEQLRITQSQLVLSEKMASLGVLMAGIAHEINNPINFIYAGVNSIIKDFDDIKIVLEAINTLDKNAGDIVEALTNIESLKKEYEFDVAYTAVNETLLDVKLGATRIKEIINSLSSFSRIESESWKHANIHEIIDNVLVLLKNKYKHHITIVKNYNESLPLVECYPGKLNQVLMNVINNAIDSIEKEKGTITLTTSLSRDMAKISILDTGKGIKEEDKHKIFDPFFTTKEVGYGLGLGLAISYSIIQEHHGEITVKSSKDVGSEFVIRIPVSQSKYNSPKSNGKV